MKKTGRDRTGGFPFSQADKAELSSLPAQTKRMPSGCKLGILAFLVTISLFAMGSTLTPLPLLLFLLLCIVAPFFPQWGFYLPIISRSISGSRAVALTFDDGPSPLSTPVILDLLKVYDFKATFFVIGEKAEKYPELIANILAGGHSIGNHSWQHDSLLMLRTKKRLGQDIRKTQEILKKHGVRPLLFRPPAGATNPRLQSVLRTEGLRTVTFSCRPFDHGNRKITNLAERISSKLKPGDIILLHDLEPQSAEETEIWKKELNILFSHLKTSSHQVAPLTTLIHSEVMPGVPTANKETKEAHPPK